MIRLASQSITRAKMLEDADIEFMQENINFDEDDILATSPKNFVYLATLGKYEVNYRTFGKDEFPLLVADTVVSVDGKILRKAYSKEQAKELLLAQSASKVSIITCMIYHSKSKKIMDISQTDYIFDVFDLDDLDVYLDSQEWMGKAGACMVEGFCKKYIKEVKGNQSTAMGLNIEILKTFI